MLEVACRYARYVRNHESPLVLSKVAGWLAATFQDPLPEDMKTRTRELVGLLGASTETDHIGSEQTTPLPAAGTGCGTPSKPL